MRSASATFLHTANDHPQVPCDWGLQRQQNERRSFGSALHLHEQLVISDDLFGPNRSACKSASVARSIPVLTLPNMSASKLASASSCSPA
jgi:hypothetical protein